MHPKEFALEWSKSNGATHCYTNPKGSMDFYRPAQGEIGWWAKCRFTLQRNILGDGQFYYTDGHWELTERLHPDCEVLK